MFESGGCSLRVAVCYAVGELMPIEICLIAELDCYRLAVEDQDQPLADLVKFPFLAAQIESDLETLFEGVVRGGGCRRLAGSPEGGDSHRGGMPAKAICCANGGSLQLVFQ